MPRPGSSSLASVNSTRAFSQALSWKPGGAGFLPGPGAWSDRWPRTSGNSCENRSRPVPPPSVSESELRLKPCPAPPPSRKPRPGSCSRAALRPSLCSLISNRAGFKRPAEPLASDYSCFQARRRNYSEARRMEGPGHSLRGAGGRSTEGGPLFRCSCPGGPGAGLEKHAG